MQVRTLTRFEADELLQRLVEANGGGLEFAPERKPPKFALRRFPGTLPVVAETFIHPRNGTSELVLRLMWGPFPARLARVIAAVGLLLAGLVLMVGGFGARALALAAILAIIPGVALLYQKTGEQQLQSKLARMLGSEGFVADRQRRL